MQLKILAHLDYLSRCVAAYVLNLYNDMQVSSETTFLPSEYSDGFYYCVLKKAKK